ncbi:hypothetical protein M5X17_27870 [Paenibacillus alvei]|uniref:hypothetical protein n=1 Tax=Paenibacillus alvei TaxID=44250 RepID=UPI00227F2458|nr:hypothetical protein [Paenibacillus alvei]MCY9737525.1 hypothetical protein [Paenibacillus alvei]
MIKMIIKLLIVSTMVFLLSACGTKYKINEVVFQGSKSAGDLFRSRHDYMIFTAKNDEIVKYLCSTEICGNLVVGTRYNITINDNRSIAPSVRIVEAIPVVAEQ